jgi:Putative prokaryotic signal transducing protein
MKRVATAESLAEIGHFRNVLEQNGIACVIRNEQLSGALGEVPFLECLPELWVIADTDRSRAEQLLSDLRQPADVGGEPWRCAACGESNESQFAVCWSCGKGDRAG